MNMPDWECIFEGYLVVLMTIVGAFMLFMIFIFAPVAMNAEARCLEAGYPEFRVTWKLDKYCMNLDGTVTVKVDKLGDDDG